PRTNFPAKGSRLRSLSQFSSQWKLLFGRRTAGSDQEAVLAETLGRNQRVDRRYQKTEHRNKEIPMLIPASCSPAALAALTARADVRHTFLLGLLELLHQPITTLMLSLLCPILWNCCRGAFFHELGLGHPKTPLACPRPRRLEHTFVRHSTTYRY